jgi:GGDEF domain-containing protein
MNLNLTASVTENAVILFLELDHFKAINCLKGHEISQKTLKKGNFKA